MLQGKNLTLTYQDGDRTIDAVHDVSISIEDHQFMGILGPSGSGKSSLLYLLSGLRKVTEGEVFLDGRAYGKMSDRERVALRRSEFGFVFQQHFLINYLTALENVMVSAPVQDTAHAEQAKALLADLGLGEKLHRFPYELSGGERQRKARRGSGAACLPIPGPPAGPWPARRAPCLAPEQRPSRSLARSGS